MGRAALAITISKGDRCELKKPARNWKTVEGLAFLTWIVQVTADELGNKVIGKLVGANAQTIGKWSWRLSEWPLDGLYNEPGSGAPRKIGDSRIGEIVARSLEEASLHGTHWRLRSLARVVGYAHTTIQRNWQAFGLQPDRLETFKLSWVPCLWKASILKP